MIRASACARQSVSAGGRLTAQGQHYHDPRVREEHGEHRPIQAVESTRIVPGLVSWAKAALLNAARR